MFIAPAIEAAIAVANCSSSLPLQGRVSKIACADLASAIVLSIRYCGLLLLMLDRYLL